MTTETTTRIIKTIAECLGLAVAEVKPESSLIDDLYCDSLDILETIMGLESEFEIEIPDQAVESMNTVQDIINYIEGNAK